MPVVALGYLLVYLRSPPQMVYRLNMKERLHG